MARPRATPRTRPASTPAADRRRREVPAVADRRRANGTGSGAFWEAARKRWRCSYPIPGQPKGWVYCSTPGQMGKRECEAKRDARLLEIALTGKVADPVKPATVGAWLEEWYDDWLDTGAVAAA